MRPDGGVFAVLCGSTPRSGDRRRAAAPSTNSRPRARHRPSAPRTARWRRECSRLLIGPQVWGGACRARARVLGPVAPPARSRGPHAHAPSRQRLRPRGVPGQGRPVTRRPPERSNKRGARPWGGGGPDARQVAGQTGLVRSKSGHGARGPGLRWARPPRSPRRPGTTSATRAPPGAPAGGPARRRRARCTRTAARAISGVARTPAAGPGRGRRISRGRRGTSAGWPRRVVAGRSIGRYCDAQRLK
jgi:hypothetical protein